MFPGNKMKALTFSYDDGVISDKRLVEILNKYNLKGTFNLNSGVQSHASNWYYKGFHVVRMNVDEIASVYQGHEIAVHCLTHADLAQFDDKTVYNELIIDKQNHERFFGCKVCGMAYPYGTYKPETPLILKNCGLVYGRTVVSSHAFDIPEDLLLYNPTCHHNDTQLFTLAEEFIKLKPDKPSVFCIWGHSYEFDGDNNWNRFEDFCRLISGRDDIYYCTNKEAFTK